MHRQAAAAATCRSESVLAVLVLVVQCLYVLEAQAAQTSSVVVLTSAQELVPLVVSYALRVVLVAQTQAAV